MRFLRLKGEFFLIGVKDGQKCPFQDSNVLGIMRTTLCRVSGDHPSLTLFAKILLQLISSLCMWARIQHSWQENTPCSLSRCSPVSILKIAKGQSAG